MSKVTPSEMTRLNTGIPAVPAASQSNFGVAGGDLAGFPNGRRPGDDTVDIALRVVMGALCYPLTIGGNSVDLGLCTAGRTRRWDRCRSRTVRRSRPPTSTRPSPI